MRCASALGASTLLLRTTTGVESVMVNAEALTALMRRGAGTTVCTTVDARVADAAGCCADATDVNAVLHATAHSVVITETTPTRPRGRCTACLGAVPRVVGDALHGAGCDIVISFIEWSICESCVSCFSVIIGRSCVTSWNAHATVLPGRAPCRWPQARPFSKPLPTSPAPSTMCRR